MAKISFWDWIMIIHVQTQVSKYMSNSLLKYWYRHANMSAKCCQCVQKYYISNRCQNSKAGGIFSQLDFAKILQGFEGDRFWLALVSFLLRLNKSFIIWPFSKCKFYISDFITCMYLYPILSWIWFRAERLYGGIFGCRWWPWFGFFSSSINGLSCQVVHLTNTSSANLTKIVK